MHKLDDDTLITPTLLRRFHAEAQFEGAPGAFYALVQRSNGHILSHQVGPIAGANEMIFASDVLTYLNKNLHHDGAWCIVFTHPAPAIPPFRTCDFQRFTILWMDEDGDVQFPLAHELGMVEAMTWGLQAWAQQCETAWMLWNHAMRQVLDPQANETFKRAKGQRRPTTLH